MPGGKPNVAEVAVSIALDECRYGVFETKNDNRGERIDEYQKTANGVLGEAYCAKFVFWCFERAANRLGVRNPMPRIFGAAELERWGASEKKLTRTPAAGDVLIKQHRHAGLVAGPASPGGIVPSVEGNTWAKTDFAHRREGVYVLNNENITTCAFIRLV